MIAKITKQEFNTLLNKSKYKFITKITLLEFYTDEEFIYVTLRLGYHHNLRRLVKFIYLNNELIRVVGDITIREVKIMSELLSNTTKGGEN